MARPRAFDVDDALEKVMHVFWRKGFDATSYDDLVTASGVSRKSLYTVYGDKHALFVAALSLYRRTIAQKIIATLENPDISKKDIAAMLERVAGQLSDSGGRKGCLMANTAVDDVAQVPPVKAHIESHLRAMSSAFDKALQRTGMPAATRARKADFFTGLLQGLFVMARAGAPRKMMMNVAKEGSAMLR